MKESTKKKGNVGVFLSRDTSASERVEKEDGDETGHVFSLESALRIREVGSNLHVQAIKSTCVIRLAFLRAKERKERSGHCRT